jgi:hypothetical protein
MHAILMRMKAGRAQAQVEHLIEDIAEKVIARGDFDDAKKRLDHDSGAGDGLGRG